MTLRRACAQCHVPLDGGAPVVDWSLVSHGLCDTCGRMLWGDMWAMVKARSGAPVVERWSGARLREAMRKAGHSKRHLAGELGVPHRRVIREVKRPVISAPLMRKLMGPPALAALYYGLTEVDHGRERRAEKENRAT